MKPILIVDDEHDILLALQLLLESEGYSVATAGNGREALHTMEKLHPGLVITDNMMPLVNGLELIQLIKKSVQFKSVPIIMMSSVRPHWSGGETKWDAFLGKPFEVDRVLAVVHRLIGPPQNSESSSLY